MMKGTRVPTWADLDDAETKIAQLQAALKAIADDPDTNVEAAAYARNALRSASAVS